MQWPYEVQVSAEYLTAQLRVFVGPPGHVQRASVFGSMLCEAGRFDGEVVTYVSSNVGFGGTKAKHVTTVEPWHLPTQNPPPLPLHYLGQLLLATLLSRPSVEFYQQYCKLLLPYARNLDLEALRTKKPLTAESLEDVVADVSRVLTRLER